MSVRLAERRAARMAYAGHQFGAFVPQLGDGRAILLGQVIDRYGMRRDIQLKGVWPNAVFTAGRRTRRARSRPAPGSPQGRDR